MKLGNSFQVLLWILLFFAPISGCKTTGVGTAGLSVGQKATIANTVLKELTAQNFDAIKTDPVDSKYMIETRVNGHPEIMHLDSGATFTCMEYGRS